MLSALLSVASAQEQSVQPPSPETPPPAATETEALTPVPGPAETPVGEGEHVVRKGDTLWDISGEALKDPFLWPRIWERNPSVVNPHRIYPGNRLVIPGPGVEAVSAPPTAEGPAPSVEAPPEAPTAPPTPVVTPPTPERREPVFEIPPAPTVPVASREALLCAPFLSEQSRRVGSGVVLKSLVPKDMISLTDEVFLRLDNTASAAPGDFFSVLRTGRAIFHPVRKSFLGFYTLTLGILEVVEVSGDSIRARVVVSCGNEVQRGDRVAPFAEPPLPDITRAQPVSDSLAGSVVGVMDEPSNMGQNNVVFVDLGNDRGVTPGDTFAVFEETARTPDPRTGRLLTLVVPPIGELVVLRVSPRSATAIITSSDREIHIGHRVSLTRKVP